MNGEEWVASAKALAADLEKKYSRACLAQVLAEYIHTKGAILRAGLNLSEAVEREVDLVTPHLDDWEELSKHRRLIKKTERLIAILDQPRRRRRRRRKAAA